MTTDKTIPFEQGRAAEVPGDLAKLQLEMIRVSDLLEGAAVNLMTATALIRNAVGKSYLDHLAAELRAMKGVVEPVRAYAWEQQKKLNNKGAGHEADKSGA